MQYNFLYFCFIPITKIMKTTINEKRRLLTIHYEMNLIGASEIEIESNVQASLIDWIESNDVLSVASMDVTDCSMKQLTIFLDHFARNNDFDKCNKIMNIIHSRN